MKRRDTLFGRREFLLASGTFALSGTLGATSAQGKTLPEGATTVTFFENSNDEAVANLAAAAQRCITTARACIDYFTDENGLSAQDSDQCVELGETVIAVCEAVVSLASVESPYLARIAMTAIEICKACENECNVRRDHQPCVDCAKACRGFIDECYRASVNAEYYL